MLCNFRNCKREDISSNNLGICKIHSDIMLYNNLLHHILAAEENKNVSNEIFDIGNSFNSSPDSIFSIVRQEVSEKYDSAVKGIQLIILDHNLIGCGLILQDPIEIYNGDTFHTDCLLLSIYQTFSYHLKKMIDSPFNDDLPLLKASFEINIIEFNRRSNSKFGIPDIFIDEYGDINLVDLYKHNVEKYSR